VLIREIAAIIAARIARTCTRRSAIEPCSRGVGGDRDSHCAARLVDLSSLCIVLRTRRRVLKPNYWWSGGTRHGLHLQSPATGFLSERAGFARRDRKRKGCDWARRK